MPKDERTSAGTPPLEGVNRTIRARGPAAELSGRSALDADLDADLDAMLSFDERGATAFGVTDHDVDPVGPRASATRFGLQARDDDESFDIDWRDEAGDADQHTHLGALNRRNDLSVAAADVRAAVGGLPPDWENDVSAFLREHQSPSGIRIPTVEVDPRAYAAQTQDPRMSQSSSAPIDQNTRFGLAPAAVLRKTRSRTSTGAQPAVVAPPKVTPAAPVAPVASTAAQPAPASHRPAAAAPLHSAGIVKPRVARTPAAAGSPRTSTSPPTSATLNAPSSRTPTLDGAPALPLATQSLDVRTGPRRDTQPIDLRHADPRLARAVDDTPPDAFTARPPAAALAPASTSPAFVTRPVDAEPVGPVRTREPNTVADEDLPYAIQNAMREARASTSQHAAVVVDDRPSAQAPAAPDRDYGEASFVATLNIQELDFDAIKNAPIDALAPAAPSPAAPSPASALAPAPATPASLAEAPLPGIGSTRLFEDDLAAQAARFAREGGALPPLDAPSIVGPAAVARSIFDAPVPTPSFLSRPMDATPAIDPAALPHPSTLEDALAFDDLAFVDTVQPRPAPIASVTPAEPASTPVAPAFAARMRAAADDARPGGAPSPVFSAETEADTLDPKPPGEAMRPVEPAALRPPAPLAQRALPDRPVRTTGPNYAHPVAPPRQNAQEWLNTNKMVVAIAVLALAIAIFTIVTLSRG